MADDYMADNNAWGIQVDRGPDWLFVRLHPGENDPSDVAERLWSVADRHFIYRIVLEMEDVAVMPSRLIGQLVMLQKRVLHHDGALRLSGVSTDCGEALHICRLDRALPTYDNRDDAVRGERRSRIDEPHRYETSGESAVSRLV